MTLFCPRCGAEFGQEFKGEWFSTAVRCADCGITVADPPLMLARGPADDEVEYSLTDWSVPERATATTALAEVDIPYRWEPGLILVVPAVAEDEVDLLLEELDVADEADGPAPDAASGGLADENDPAGDGEAEDGAAEDGAAEEDDVGGAAEEDDDVDGGEEAQAAMADLFVVADRLQHDPADVHLGAKLAGLAATVAASSPPYGIARPVWRQIQGLSATVVTGLEQGGDDDTVAADARSLRDFLRDLV